MSERSYCSGTGCGACSGTMNGYCNVAQTHRVIGRCGHTNTNESKCMILTACRPTVRPRATNSFFLHGQPSCGLPHHTALQFQQTSFLPSPTSRPASRHWSEPQGLSGEGHGRTEQQELLTLESEQTPREPYLEVGSIITTHGVRGEIKVQALTDFPEERLLTPGSRWITVSCIMMKFLLLLF